MKGSTLHWVRRNNSPNQPIPTQSPAVAVASTPVSADMPTYTPTPVPSTL
jgi:hypothetical protein